MSTPADAIYSLIKSNESHFPLPIPYVIENVGTFDAASGTFSRLTTTVDFDPEPMEHGANQHPTNPAPGFVGQRWVSVTINSKWQKTVTSTPAPQVSLAPVALQFSVANASSSWTVVANGVTVTAPSTQKTLTVSVWDDGIISWNVSAGSKSYHDSLRIQRPAGASDFGIGAFTIPVIPVSIIYAPPADSLNKSVAAYSQGQTIGTSVTNSFSTDSSTTTADGQAQYTGLGDFTAGLSTISKTLSLLKGGHISAADSAAYAAGGAILDAISSQLGKFIGNIQTGITNSSDSTVTITQTTSSGIGTLANAGGPGQGDVLHFYKDVKMAWSSLNGRLSLTPLGYTEASFAASGIQKNLSTLGISASDAQLLLNLDPFVAGGPQAQLPTDRFTFQENVEYGFGTTLPLATSVTRDTKNTTTQKSYTTTTEEWDAGPIFQLLGFGGKDQTTTTVTNATGSDVSSVITLSANLASGPSDHFNVNVWYDNLFGTFAFQEVALLGSPRLQGSGASSGQIVTLTAGGKVFRTVADKNGGYAFHAPNIPSGSAMLSIGSQAPKPITIPGSTVNGVTEGTDGTALTDKV